MDSWSRKFFPDLTEYEHNVNDAWFERMRELLNPAGILVVPTLAKAFDKRGEEVSLPDA